MSHGRCSIEHVAHTTHEHYQRIAMSEFQEVHTAADQNFGVALCVKGSKRDEHDLEGISIG
jgi:hypothetical protein